MNYVLTKRLKFKILNSKLTKVVIYTVKILRNIIIATLIMALLPSFPVFAADDVVNWRLEGGIMNEIEYKEVIFVTGEPIWLSGKAKVTQSGRGESIQTRITYNLTDASGQVKLSRSTGFTSKITKKLSEKQTVSVTDLTSYSENITIGKDKYTLSDYQYSRSVLTDHKPGVDYFSGDWEAKKIYTLNKNQATITVESWGTTVGYNHAWGSTETQTVDNTVTFSGKKIVTTDEKEQKTYDQKWSGTYQLNLSYNLGKTLTYESNEPTQISFEGGFLEKTQEEQILGCSYNMPKFDKNGLVKEARTKDSEDIKLTTTPTYRRLPIPYLRDVKGHWAEYDILRLASLEALPIKGEYLGPRLNMTRGEFAYAMSVLCQLVEEEETTTRRTNTRTASNKNKEQETSPFADVPTSHPYYKYIKAAYDKGVISGVSKSKFSPDAPLTRAQAVTIMIKALGFEGLAPMYGNNTDYLDDASIPYWAKDAIYVGTEIGLVSGTNGYVRPNETMSRAEAAAFLNRFLTYLQQDLRYEYRERLLNYR